jgi:hypothetical protein
VASIGAVLAYHAISIWVPGCGGLIALLSSRRTPFTVQPAVVAPGLAGTQLAQATQAKA